MESGLDKGGQGDNVVSVSLSVSGSSSSSALIRGGQIIGTSGAEGGGGRLVCQERVGQAGGILIGFRVFRGQPM